MLPRRSVSNPWRTATRRRAICCGLVGLSFLAIVASGLLPGTRAAENTLPYPQLSQAPARIQPKRVASYGKLPLRFEANQGQTDARVRFLARGGGYTIFLTADEAVLALKRSSIVSSRSPVAPPGISSTALRMRLVDANVKATVRGAEELPGKSNYFIGNDPKKWRTNVSSYARVKYEGVYPGVDLVYYGNQGQLEYDFVVKPGADPAAIRFALSGGLEVGSRQKAEGGGLKALGSGQSAVGSESQNQTAPQSKIQNLKSKIDPSGDLVVKIEGGEIRFHKPVVYQRKSPANRQSSIINRQFLDGHYVLRAGNRVGFEVASYDHTQPLVIDPALVYSTYLGGSFEDEGYAIAVDSSGSAYVTGATLSTDFPTVNALQPNFGGSGPGSVGDAFVAKLDPTGSTLVYSTYLGGSNDDSGYGIAVDSSGNAYVTGSTMSDNFPTANPLQASNKSTGGTAFVTELNAAGSALVYSTYLGGSNEDSGAGIAVDSSGNAYVTGMTESDDFPTVNPVQTSLRGHSNVFLTEVNATGSALVYSTYLGGSGVDVGQGIAVDSSGNAYVTGSTTSTNFPTVKPFQLTNKATPSTEHPTAFVAKLNAAGSAFIYATYLGGNKWDSGQGIAVDSSGNAYVTGFTTSTTFPTAKPYQATNKAALGTMGGDTAFVATLNPAGSALVYSTYLGGSEWDSGNAIAVDAYGNAYVTGGTYSTDFPTLNATQPTCASCSTDADAFVTELNSAGSALVYSTYLGGSNNDHGQGIAVDASGDAYVAGVTSSADFPHATQIPGACNGTCGTGGVTGDAFVAEIAGVSAPAVSLNSYSLTFPSQTVNTTSAAQSVTLTNTGTEPLTITQLAASGDFALASTETTCSISVPVAAGKNCTIAVTFTPTAAGTRSGAMTITDNSNGVTGSTQTVILTGTGTGQGPMAGVAPSTLTFTSQTLGTTSGSQPVTLSNPGSASLAIASIVAGANFGQTNNCGSSVAVGGSCTINVTFSPTATGLLTSALTITDNSNGVAGSTQTVVLTGTGAAPVPVAGVSPLSLTFGTQTVGTTSAPEPVTLSNTGTAALTIASIATSANFGQTNNCGSSLATNSSCTINVTFSPTAGGANAGNLIITDNSSGVAGSTQTVQLSQTGTSQDFTLGAASGSSTSATVAPGSAATYTLGVGGQAGFFGTVAFTCTGAPAGAACTVWPNKVTVGSSANNFNVTVTTTAPSLSAPRSRPLPPIPPLSPCLSGLLILAMVLAAMAWTIVRRTQPGMSRWQSTLVPLAAGLLLALALAGCGGGGGGGGVAPPPVTPTPPGVYSLTVTGTATSGSSTLTHSVTLTLNVS